MTCEFKMNLLCKLHSEVGRELRKCIQYANPSLLCCELYTESAVNLGIILMVSLGLMGLLAMV